MYFKALGNLAIGERAVFPDKVRVSNQLCDQQNMHVASSMWLAMEWHKAHRLLHSCHSVVQPAWP
jgi:hypothetical protein